MRSPFHSEQEAFRFVVLLTFALIPIMLAAALGPTWLALVVIAVVLAVLAVRVWQLGMRRRGALELRVKSAPAHLGPAAERRVLVLANDTLGEEALLGELGRLVAEPGTHVRLVAPAIVSPGARLTGDLDRAVEQARSRLSAAMARVGDHLDLEGEVSEADPVEAIEDAFATFAPDEVIICTRRQGGGGRLDPGLAGLVREHFAVPVRHLIFVPGLDAFEPDEDTEARYRQQFRDAVAARHRKAGLQALTGVGVLAALLMSAFALIQSATRNELGTAAPLVVAPAAAAAPAATTVVPNVVDLKLIPSYKLGPDGKKHDAFTKTDFAVKVGQPLQLRIDNTDTQPHSITSPTAGVNIIVQPGTHTYTLTVSKPGTFPWFCVFPCDPWSMTHIGYMRGYITAS